MIINNVKAKAVFKDDRYNAIGLAGSDHGKAMLVCLKSRQFIPVHAPGIDIFALVLEGHGVLRDQETAQRAGPGDMLFVQAGLNRGILAETEMILWVVVSPPPGPNDHVLVEKLLKDGLWRDDAVVDGVDHA